MPTAKNCPRCQTPFPVDAPCGACPACLLRVALGDTPTPNGASRAADPGMIEYRDVGTTDLTPAAETVAFGPNAVVETPANTPRAVPTVAPGGSPLTIPHDGTWPAADGTADDRGESTADIQPGPARITGRGPPGYEVLGELGRGGMGAVYKARQVALDRIVALKVVHGIGATHPTVHERFAAEARALGRLKHPNIVQVYDVGEENGCPFYALEYVAGGSLARRLRAGPLAPKEAAELIRALARGVGAAHAAGILHRDIKPANVLLSEVDEPSIDTAVGGSELVPKLTDFGLVKWLNESDGLTGTNSVMGTPSYMAPEQAAGRNKEVGPRTDVYALGATLYETLTGSPPFLADTPVAIVAAVVNNEPVRPIVKRPGLSTELEAICLKCLEKTPGNRYPSADALADDLGRWLRGESTLARPLGPVKRLWRRVKRRRWAVAAVGAMVLAASGAYAAASYLGPEPERVFLVPDPDAKLKEIQAELADGKRVTLIGPTGLPRWHRWALAPATLGESQEVHDHTCGLQTMERSLLELVQDPGTDCYRFSAEVRHDRSLVLPIPATTASVGVYFGYRSRGDAGREEHRFFSVDLSEYPINRPASSAPNPRGARWRHAISIREENDNMPRRHELNLEFFPVEEPAQPMPWRTIVVTVTSTTVRVEMPLEPAGEAVTKTWEQVRRMTGQLVTPRLPLGIYASSSLVSVRNVVLEPLR